MASTWTRSTTSAPTSLARSCARRGLHTDLGKAAIIAITGGEWFQDLAPGETTVDLDVGGSTLSCSIDVLDVEIAI